MFIVYLLRKKVLISLLFFILASTTIAQPVEFKYRKPLDLAISLSANFAEIRSNHFHSGIDFRVGGVAGAKLYAVADGYIARIFVSPWGYGKALYINHPNGETSVYGHMDGFSEKIHNYVESIQYSKQTFVIDEIVEPDSIPVKKGELIGYAGNTGSSFGAHLHFEIRHTYNQMPINAITNKIFEVTDNVPPTIHRMAVFTLDSTFSITTPRLLKSSKVVKKGDVFVPEANTVFEVFNPVYFGVYANDYMPNSNNKFGVNRMTAYIDGEPFFGYLLDEFSLDETRYINSFIAYEELIENNQSYVKTYVEQGNKLSIYRDVADNGLIILNDTLVHNVKLELFDDSGNKTTLAFKIKKSKKNNPKNNSLLNPEIYKPVRWNMPYKYENDDMKLYMPECSLYSNILFTLNSSPAKKNMYSPIWNIGNPKTPLHKHITISLRPDIPENLKEKAVIVRMDKNNKFSSVGGAWDDENEFITANVINFGSYSVALDTIPPTIKFAFKRGVDLRDQKLLKITISDDLSGIATYNAYIDDKWALFDYDAKTRSLTYKFDAKYIKKGQRHKLKVVVDDGRNNTSTFNTEFLW